MIVGSVLELYIAPEGTSGVREEQSSLNLKESYGINGDKFANKELRKSVMIVGTKPYNMAKDKDITLPKAALGENILLDFDPHTLNIGDRLLIGNAVIEITEACTLCKHLTKYDNSLPKLIVKHRGIYCKIVKSGSISKGDKVELLEQKEAC